MIIMDFMVIWKPENGGELNLLWWMVTTANVYCERRTAEAAATQWVAEVAEGDGVVNNESLWMR